MDLHRKLACFRASVKYGAIITELKGSIGGQTFKGTAMGGVMQNKINRAAAGKSGGKITKADAGKIISVINNTTTNSKNWRNLTSLERAAWVTAAPNFPFINKFGEPYTPSGYQLYMSCNNQILNIGQTVIDDPPPVETIDNTPSFTITDTAVVGALMQMDGTIPAGYYMTVYASANQSAGRGYEAGRMKAIVILPPGASFPYDLDPDYINLFGIIPAVRSVWFEAKITKADAGRSGLTYKVQQNT